MSTAKERTVTIIKTVANRVIGKKAEQAVMRAGDGRSFVVAHRGQRLVITAAHCLPAGEDGRLNLPPPNPASHTEERTYRNLLGPLGDEPAVWAECLFVDPIADIAVLGMPDHQGLADEAAAYETLVEKMTPLLIADAPKMLRKRVQLSPGHTIDVLEPGRGAAYVPSLTGEWLHCTVARHRNSISIDEYGQVVQNGMSGSPIITPDGEAISLASTGPLNPVLRDNLPAWFFRAPGMRG
jgi:hypothetical protein